MTVEYIVYLITSCLAILIMPGPGVLYFLGVFWLFIFAKWLLERRIATLEKRIIISEKREIERRKNERF